VSSSLTIPVRWFVDDVSAALHELAHTTAEDDEGPGHDAATEAFNLTCGFIDADGLHTDDELWALITAFGPMLPTQLGQATPQDVRKAGLVTDARTKLTNVTSMFELLVQADSKNGTRHSHTYYRAALEIGFAIAAVDAHTSNTELGVIGDFQKLLLETQVISLQVPGSEGYLGILAHHAPLITALKAGKLDVRDATGRVTSYDVTGGFLEVSNNRASVLADSAELRAS